MVYGEVAVDGAGEMWRRAQMSEHTSTESSRSRWTTRISFALAAIAALVVLGSIVCVVTVYVVTEKYDGLHDAVEKGDTFAVRCFLLRGADVNAKNERSRTPLRFAAWSGHTEVAELLIDNGADVNAKDKWGRTPLYWTAGRGFRDIAELLIDKGADMNAKDNHGSRPLHQAAFFGHTEVAKLLIARGADVNAKDKKGRTPLQLIDKGADVNAKTKLGRMPLALAVKEGHKDVAALLRKHGGKK